MRGRRLRRPPGRPPPARRTRARSGRKACARSAALRRRGGAPGRHARCRGSRARRTGRSRPREERCERNEQRIDEGEEGERRVELAVGLDLKADALRVHGDGDEQEADEGRGSRRDGAQQRGVGMGHAVPPRGRLGRGGHPGRHSGLVRRRAPAPVQGSSRQAAAQRATRTVGGSVGGWGADADGGRSKQAADGRSRLRAGGAGGGEGQGAAGTVALGQGRDRPWQASRPACSHRRPAAWRHRLGARRSLVRGSRRRWRS